MCSLSTSIIIYNELGTTGGIASQWDQLWGHDWSWENHVYVPSKDVEREFKIPNKEGPESAIKIENKKFTTFLKGDQLTVARIRSADDTW